MMPTPNTILEKLRTAPKGLRYAALALPVAVVLGLGQGGSFSMALTLLALRAPDADSAAELSGMAQGAGYVMAAMGPLAIGVIHDWRGSWAACGVLLAVIGVAAMLAGLGAGRNRWISAG